MGVETALAIGGTLVGGAMQYGENRAARKRSQQVADQAANITGAPLSSTGAIQGALNSGQDSYLQYLRSDPNALKPFSFDASSAFKQLQGQDTQVINDQANALSAGAGSLGARFGSGFAAKDALLRGRFANDIAARNAGISQSSFNTALTAGMSDFQSKQNRQTQLLQLLSGNELAARGQQLQGLGLGASQPYPSTGALVSQTGGDIASLMMLMKYLNGGGGGTPTKAPANIPQSIVPPNYTPSPYMPG